MSRWSANLRRGLFILVAGMILLGWGGFIIAIGAQTPRVRVQTAWLSPDNQVLLQVTAPDAIQSAVLISSGTPAQSLTIKTEPLASHTWILLDASQTMLNRQLIVQSALAPFLAETSLPITLLTYQQHIEPALTADTDNRAVLTHYTATAGTNGCLGDALRRIPDETQPVATVWRILVITGGWTAQTNCENPVLPQVSLPVDIVLLGMLPAPELEMLAQTTGGVLLTSDVRQFANRFDTLRAQWALPTTLLMGTLPPAAPTEVTLKLTLADGTLTEHRLNLRILPTPTPTVTPTATLTPMPSATLIPSATPMPSATPTATLTATPTATATASPTATLTLTATATATVTPSATLTATATATLTATLAPTLTPTHTATLTSTATALAGLVPAQESPGASGVPTTPVDPQTDPETSDWNNMNVALLGLALMAGMGWLTAIALYFRIPRIIAIPTQPPSAPGEAQTFYDSLGPRDAFAAPLPPVRPTSQTAMRQLPTRQRQRTDFTAKHDPLLTPLTTDKPLSEPPEWLHTGTQLISELDVEQMLESDVTPNTDSDMVIGWLRLISLDPPIDYALYQHKPIMTMGQAIDNAIVLPEDAAILLHHARLDISPTGSVTLTGLSVDHRIMINQRFISGAYTLQANDEIYFSEQSQFIYLMPDNTTIDTEPPESLS